jgi:hypothetical protein
VDEGVASLGACVYSGSQLVVECSEWVSTSSSVNGSSAILNLSTEGKRVRTYVLAMHSCINSVHC